jgi:hypothetical protein
MKTTITASLSMVSLACFFIMLQILSSAASAFTTLPGAFQGGGGVMMRTGGVTAGSVRSATQLYFFGAPKDDGLPGDYVCKVCMLF